MITCTKFRQRVLRNCNTFCDLDPASTMTGGRPHLYGCFHYSATRRRPLLTGDRGGGLRREESFEVDKLRLELAALNKQLVNSMNARQRRLNLTTTPHYTLSTLYRRFPDNHCPGQTFPGPDKLYKGIFMYIVCVNTSCIGLVTRYVSIRSVY